MPNGSTSLSATGLEKVYRSTIRSCVDFSVRFSIVNLAKPESLYREGMRPCIFSVQKHRAQGIGWSRDRDRSCHTISYRRNTESTPRLVALGLWDQVRGLSTLSFSYTFTEPEDCVYFAHSFPYTHTRLQRVVREMKDDPELETRFAVGTLAHSLGCNPCYVCTISEDVKSSLRNAEVPALQRILRGKEEKTIIETTSCAVKQKKPAVVLTGRIHPGETNSSFILEGLMRFLVSSDPRAKRLREKFVFYIIPMLNPDGVISGNYRCSLVGADLNRQWRKPSRLLHPTVFAAKEFMSDLAKTTEIFSYCDFHGHSSKRDAFMMGCTFPLLTSEESKQKNLRIRVLPFLLSRLNPAFSYAAATFGLEKRKEGTGRVVVFRELGVPLSYTLETSFYGSEGVANSTIESEESKSPKRDIAFTLDYLRLMGRDFALVYLVLERALQLPSTRASKGTRLKDLETLVQPLRPVRLLPAKKVHTAAVSPSAIKPKPSQHLRFKLRKTTILPQNLNVTQSLCRRKDRLNASLVVRPTDSSGQVVIPSRINHGVNAELKSPPPAGTRNKMRPLVLPSAVVSVTSRPEENLMPQSTSMLRAQVKDSEIAHYQSLNMIAEPLSRTRIALGQYLSKYEPDCSRVTCKHFRQRRTRASRMRILKETTEERVVDFEEPSFRGLYHGARLCGPIVSKCYENGGKVAIPFAKKQPHKRGATMHRHCRYPSQTVTLDNSMTEVAAKGWDEPGSGNKAGANVRVADWTYVKSGLTEDETFGEMARKISAFFQGIRGSHQE